MLVDHAQSADVLPLAPEIAAGICRLVCRTRLGAPAAPAGADRTRAARRECAAGSADRWRQDAGRLPAQPDRAGRQRRQRARKSALHTLYISPLKALAVDVARNLETPVAEMGLPVRVETRTGDTPAGRRQRQKYMPPDLLLTTPEQFALLLASRDAPRFFEHVKAVVLDELHAMHNSKRGDLLALGLVETCRRWRRAIAASAFPPPSPIRGPCSAFLCRSRWMARRCRRSSSARPVRGRRSRSARRNPMCLGQAIWRATPCRRFWRR